MPCWLDISHVPIANNFVTFQSFIEYLLCTFLSSRLFLHCWSTFSFLLYSYCKLKWGSGFLCNIKTWIYSKIWTKQTFWVMHSNGSCHSFNSILSTNHWISTLYRSMHLILIILLTARGSILASYFTDVKYEY